MIQVPMFLFPVHIIKVGVNFISREEQKLVNYWDSMVVLS